MPQTLETGLYWITKKKQKMNFGKYYTQFEINCTWTTYKTNWINQYWNVQIENLFL